MHGHVIVMSLESHFEKENKQTIFQTGKTEWPTESEIVDLFDTLNTIGYIGKKK